MAPPSGGMWPGATSAVTTRCSSGSSGTFVCAGPATPYYHQGSAAPAANGKKIPMPPHVQFQHRNLEDADPLGLSLCRLASWEKQRAEAALERSAWLLLLGRKTQQARGAEHTGGGEPVDGTRRAKFALGNVYLQQQQGKRSGRHEHRAAHKPKQLPPQLRGSDGAAQLCARCASEVRFSTAHTVLVALLGLRCGPSAVRTASGRPCRLRATLRSGVEVLLLLGHGPVSPRAILRAAAPGISETHTS